MSKLFDTLEKIQEQETSSPRREQATTPPPARKTSRYFPFLLGLTIIVAIIAAGQYLPVLNKALTRQPERITANKQTDPPPSKSRVTHATSRAPEDHLQPGPAQIEYLNNHAVTLTEKGDAWAALYYFDKASKLAPHQVEPLINMAIILSQMDLGFPAGRIFKQAYQLDPDNDYLHQAIELAIAEQVLPPDFYETIPLPEMEGK